MKTFFKRAISILLSTIILSASIVVLSAQNNTINNRSFITPIEADAAFQPYNAILIVDSCIYNAANFNKALYAKPCGTIIAVFAEKDGFAKVSNTQEQWIPSHIIERIPESIAKEFNKMNHNNHIDFETVPNSTNLFQPEEKIDFSVIEGRSIKTYQLNSSFEYYYERRFSNNKIYVYAIIRYFCPHCGLEYIFEKLIYTEPDNRDVVSQALSKINDSPKPTPTTTTTTAKKPKVTTTTTTKKPKVITTTTTKKPKTNSETKKPNGSTGGGCSTGGSVSGSNTKKK